MPIAYKQIVGKIMMNNSESIREIISNDKRKCERLDLEIEVLYSLYKGASLPEEWVGPFVIDNICGDGLSLSIDKQMEKNTGLHVKIRICSESDPIHCYGKVVWCKESISSEMVKDIKTIHPFVIGVQFDEVHENDKKRFVNYISDQILSKYLGK